MAKVYQNDIGTQIIINLQENISAATDYSLLVQKPDGTEVTWTPSIYNTKYLKYTTVSNDLDQVGEYKIQPQLTLDGWTGKGNTVTLNIYRGYS